MVAASVVRMTFASSDEPIRFSFRASSRALSTSSRRVKIRSQFAARPELSASTTFGNSAICTDSARLPGRFSQASSAVKASIGASSRQSESDIW